MRSWLRGAFCMAALVSFAANYYVVTGRFAVQPQGGGYQEADYISAAEALKPVKLTRGR